MTSKHPDRDVGTPGGRTTPRAPEDTQPQDTIRDIARASADDLLRPDEADRFAETFSRQFLNRMMSGEAGFGLATIEMIERHHAGPIPPAETLAGYEDVVPGAAKRVFDMAERDQEAFIESQRAQQISDNRFRLTSYIGGFIALVLILATGSILAFHGHEASSLAAFGMGAVSIIGVFVNAWKQKK